jgi:hypothetical protein
MNDKYWQKFYKDKKIPGPSDFAIFCFEGQDSYAKKTLLEVGAGDGRDSDYISDFVFNIHSLEPNNDLSKFNFIHSHHETFERFYNNKNNNLSFDIIYARWFIHAVEGEIEDMLLNFAEKQNATLMVEFRVIGDKPDDTHGRRLINPVKFFAKLINKGFIIKYFEVDYGLSKHGDNDPYLARVIAEHKGR